MRIDLLPHSAFRVKLLPENLVRLGMITYSFHPIRPPIRVALRFPTSFQHLLRALMRLLAVMWSTNVRRKYTRASLMKKCVGTVS